MRPFNIPLVILLIYSTFTTLCLIAEPNNKKDYKQIRNTKDLKIQIKINQLNETLGKLAESNLDSARSLDNLQTRLNALEKNLLASASFVTPTYKDEHYHESDSRPKSPDKNVLNNDFDNYINIRDKLFFQQVKYFFLNDVIDTRWSHNAQNQLQNIFFTDFEFTDTSLVSVTCKSFICEIITAHDTAESLTNYFDDIQNKLPWQSEVLTEISKYDEDNAVFESRVFIAKSGKFILSEE